MTCWVYGKKEFKTWIQQVYFIERKNWNKGSIIGRIVMIWEEESLKSVKETKKSEILEIIDKIKFELFCFCNN